MRFKKNGMFGMAKFAPADVPAGDTPVDPLVQAVNTLEKAEATPTSTMSPEEAQKVFEDAQKEAEANKEETLEQKVERLQKELEEAKKAPEKKEAEKEVDPLKDVTKKAEEAGVNVSELEQEYINNGKLSEESMKALKEAGFSEEAVQAYIQVKEHQAIERDNTVLKSVGISSREEYINMAVWMSKNFDEDTLAKYDSAMSTPVADVMIEKYYKLYVEATGGSQKAPESTQPVSVRAGSVNTPSSSQGAFKSESEMIKAIQDPRYETDISYRNSVITRIMASPYKR